MVILMLGGTSSMRGKSQKMLTAIICKKKKKRGGDLRFVDDTVRHLQKTSAEGQVIN